MISARLAVLVVAVVVCAWYGLGIRELHDQARVRALVQGHARITTTQAKAADATLGEAAFLNPDRSSVDSLRSIVANKAGDRRAAVTIARAVALAEPQNVGNWLLLSYLFAGTDSATLRLAQAHIRALAPPVPFPR